MDISNILQTFITPPIPYFFLGLLAAFAKSDLEIPGPIAKFISLYLLMAEYSKINSFFRCLKIRIAILSFI